MERKRLLEREIEFHNEWATSVDPAAVNVRAGFTEPTAVENQFIIERMEPLAGKRVLDVGAGIGGSSVYFALQGADVTASETSEGMVKFAIALGRRHGVQIERVVAAGQQLRVK
jgi:2-polyprenyl-3-methyl-5-hydroxy-6-metoxy-1,4-benzoquinol methylase